MSLRLPLVVILGATGSGKTKLSLDLAKKFGGEIIGADSMQIYKNLDIISAKATVEERKVAPHHLIDILHPHEICTVLDYRNKALQIIDDLFCANKLPIIVGGTNYYIESILWKILVDEPGSERKVDPGSNVSKYHELTNEELHQKLKVLDPAMARRLHPNNKRKVLRSLEILQQKGRLHSDILKEQQSSDGGNSLGGGLRYSNTIIFWLKWDQETLNQRINSRVDSMMQEGLVDELLNFHKSYNTHSTPDYTKGIFQMIGFKEFHDFLMLNEDNRQTGEGQKKLNEGIQSLKMVTRRYAKKQIRWVQNRFLAKTEREIPPVYQLTTDDLDKWDEKITTPAVEIIENFIREADSPYEKLPPIENNKSNPNSLDDTHNCEVCHRVFVGEFQWSIHLKSHRHKRALQKKKRLENLQELVV